MDSYYQVQHYVNGKWRKINCAERINDRKEAEKLLENFRKTYAPPQNIRAVEITEKVI